MQKKERKECNTLVLNSTPNVSPSPGTETRIKQRILLSMAKAERAGR